MAAGGRAVDFADHEELVAGRVCFGDFLDPGFRDAHDAALGHLHGVGFDVQDAEGRRDGILDLAEDGEEGRRGETEVVFDVFLVVAGAFAEVIEPEGFNDTVFADEHSAPALAAEVCVNGYGVEVDGSITGRGGIGRDGDGSDIGDCCWGDHWAKILIEARKIVCAPCLIQSVAKVAL